MPCNCTKKKLSTQPKIVKAPTRSSLYNTASNESSTKRFIRRATK